MKQQPSIKTEDVLTLFIAIDLLLNNQQIYPDLLKPLGHSYSNIKSYLNARGLISEESNKTEDLVHIED
jgi:hypothetical protein